MAQQAALLAQDRAEELKALAPPSKDKFAQIVSDALHQLGIGDDTEYDREDFKLTIGESVTFWLDIAYRDYCAAPRRERKSIIDRYLKSFVGGSIDDIPDEYDDARANVLPRLRDRLTYELLALQDGAQKPDMTSLGDSFGIELVYDFPFTIASLPGDKIEKWGVGRETVLEDARTNLWKMSNEDFKQPQPGLFVSPWQDNYDATRIVLHDLIWQLRVNGDHIAMAPHRDLLIVTGSNDDDGLQKMCSLAHEALEDSRALTGFALRLNDGRWEMFRPAGAGTGRKAIRNLNTRSMASAYAQQKEPLQKALERDGTDIFVATAMLVENNETGELETIATWTKGEDTLLPESNRIAFIDPDKMDEGHMAEWGDVVEAVGDLMERSIHWPPRYRVRRFPTDVQLASFPDL